MGNQPGLDGVRAVSVAIVVLYHAGLSWMHGGFFGVEVFFVVSGFLITTLLLEERRATGAVSLRGFWLRRARRLLPALFVVLVCVSLWAVLVQPEYAADLRRTLLPAVFYVSNWAEIFGDVPYFSPATPPLRHLWSLAVEEQWYLAWPLAFVLLMRVLPTRAARRAAVLAGAALAIMVWSAWLAGSSDPLLGVVGREVDRFNFLYLNTFGRASGLLLGAAAAMVWQPWALVRTQPGGELPRRRGLDVAGLAAVAVVVLIAATRSDDVLVDPLLYRLWMPLVTVASLVAVAVVVDPRATMARRVFGWRPLVVIGQRSYGIYLWHWPVFAFAGVPGHPSRLVPALMMTAGLSELCFRLVETPIRRGVIGRTWAELGHRDPQMRARWALAAGTATVVIVAGIALAVRAAPTDDPAVGDQQVTFDASQALGSTEVTAAGPITQPAVLPATATPVSGVPATTLPVAAAPVTAPSRPRSVVLVGDSQAMSLARNLPDGIEEYFTVTDGSVEGCGVQSDGKLVTARSGFSTNFARCADWEREWAQAARSSNAELALVVVGAWDVFDQVVDGVTVPFGSPEGDARFVAGIERGVAALRAEGAHVALLEVPCMRPIDAKGAGVPALPERGDDARVARLNELLRQVAAADPESLTFVPGPTEWCADPAIASDTGYRWDGVHVYQQGAALIMEAISAPLLAIPL